jgi:hypothetical protein
MVRVSVWPLWTVAIGRAVEREEPVYPSLPTKAMTVTG